MANWYQISVAAELDEADAQNLDEVIRAAALRWEAEHGGYVHIDMSVGHPSWLEKARDCQVPDCGFPAEWEITVTVDGGVGGGSYLACGKHRLEVVEAAASSSEVAWGEAQVAAAKL